MMIFHRRLRLGAGIRRMRLRDSQRARVLPDVLLDRRRQAGHAEHSLKVLARTGVRAGGPGWEGPAAALDDDLLDAETQRLLLHQRQQPGGGTES